MSEKISNSKQILTKYKEIIYSGFLIRKVEEKLLELFSAGKINGTVHTCIGQELIASCIANELEEDDFILSNHRGHGHYIARTGDVDGLIAEVMGRTSGASGGIGGSQHLINHQYLSNGIQGGMIPIAAGISLAFKMNASNNIAVAFIGDGTLGEGVIYETFNICSLWGLPLLIVLENNGYAQSTSAKQTFSGKLQSRVEGFGLRYARTSTWCIDDLTSNVSKAVNTVRNEQIPFLLEIETYRLKSHSKGDDNRNDQEVKDYSEKDLLSTIALNSSDEIADLLMGVDVKIEKAVDNALKNPILESFESDATTINSYRFKEIPPPLSDKKINEMIYDGFKHLFEVNDKLMLIGEDLEYTTSWTPKPYGGAFKVSRDLSSLFEGRVKNTPISEAAIVGIGTGLALAGQKPIVEIMFGDFLTLAFDQIINHATKFCSMFGRKVNVPLIIRTPMGGRRGYGPTHSQTLEKHLFGIPNLSIVALNYRLNPLDTYKKITETINHPVLVVENKVLYTRTPGPTRVGFSTFATDEDFPTIKVTANDECTPDITIVCYGGLLEEAEEALELIFDEDEILCEIICPTLISPLNCKPILDSAKKTRRLLVVEEGVCINALGSEIAAVCMENSIQLESFVRMGTNSIIPCSYVAEMNLLPTAKSIASTVREMVNG